MVLTFGSLSILPIPVTPFRQNCLLIWAEGRGAVLDPGGDAGTILEAAAKHRVRIETILLTHGHLDHAGGVIPLRSELGGGTPIIGPDRQDRFLLDGLPEQGRLFGLDGLSPVTPDRWLREGEEVEIAGERFEVLHCPGHTPGHVVFAHPGLRLALVGDVLFRGSVGRTDFPYGDSAALIASIHRKLLPLGDDTRFLCGHGPGSSFGEERRLNPFLQEGFPT